MRNWKYWCVVGLAVVVVTQASKSVGRALGRPAARQASSQLPPASEPQMQVVVASQDAQGVTQSDLGPTFLANFKKYTVERIKANAEKYLASQGLPSETVDIQSESLYIESGTTRLAVVRVHDAHSSNVVIAGIVGNELKRVTCGRMSTEPIPLSYGPCAERISSTFAVSLATSR